MRVRRRSLESDSHSRGSALIAINTSRAAEIIDNEIQIAVAIEIAHSDCVMDPELIGAPLCRRFLKLITAQVVKGDDRHVQRRIKTRVLDLALNERFQPRLGIGNLGYLGSSISAGSNLFLRIQVLDVFGVAGGNKHVLVTVEIHIQKNR